MDYMKHGEDAEVDGVRYPWLEEHHAWLWRTEESYTAFVSPMLYNERLTLLLGPLEQAFRWDVVGAWCFQRGPATFRALRDWEPLVAEPSGWFRDVMRDRYDYSAPGAPVAPARGPAHS
ncbi:hypothetical protein ACIGXM_14705 [Kitasatospora sp. NPDC052896]|uniref:hypothetical protein n=1 Tax=Kitasatospora sp. NPDC052896 TaxID=3364061 RepID=UPI0037C6BA7D